ncbi:MAG: 6-phosphogluconolactonase [Acidimicrobiia bacterium]
MIGFLEATPAARICLPTGSTPRPMYRAFSDGGGDLSGATVFLLDELGLPAGSAARCDQMIRRDLLDLPGPPPGTLDAINVDAADLEAECRRYEAAICAGGLDLTILGLGGNGHVGLNEPGSDRDTATRVVQLAPETGRHTVIYGADTPATWGATMGIETLLGSDELWLLVTGAHKADVLAQTLTADIGPELPATFLRTHPRVTVFADDLAAAAYS